MGDSRASSGFGEIDTDLVHDEPRPPSERGTFGQVDLDIADDPNSIVPVPQSSTFERPPTSPHTKTTMKKVEDPDGPSAAGATDATRIQKGDALSSLTRAKLAQVPSTTEPTRTGSIDDMVAIAASGRGDVEEPPGSGPSGSGIATRDMRVAAMRELYAKGDADGALRLASKLVEDGVAALAEIGQPTDAPDARIETPRSVQEIEIDVEFDEPQAPPSTSGPPTPLLTLTERQGIPRVVKDQAEIAKLPIDHRAGFLLGFIDGMQTMEEILDVCAMPLEDALQLLKDLEQLGVITIE